jgi:excisionase family DNA binding protein
MEEHDLMTVAEVATGLRVSKMTIYRLIQAGQLETIRVGRAFRVKTASYAAFKAGGGAAE